MNLFFTNETVSMDVLNVIIYLVIIIYSITLFIGYFVNLKLFKKDFLNISENVVVSTVLIMFFSNLPIQAVT